MWINLLSATDVKCRESILSSRNGYRRVAVLVVSIFVISECVAAEGLVMTSRGTANDVPSIQVAEAEELWSRGKEQVFQGVGGIKIVTRSFVRPDQVGGVVICSGRTECMLKYQELILDFHKKGYSVYILDHRGQGYSGRMLPDSPQIGYVKNFDDYVTDLV